MKKLLFLLLLALPAYAQNVIPIVNGNVTINPTTPSNSFKILVNQAVTVNIINPPGGFPPTVNVLFQQDGTGHAVTYGNTIVNGPTVSSSPNAVTSGSFQFDGSTNTWYGVSGGGSGGGGGTVTGVTGTTNQITVTNPTTTPVLSLPSTLVLPNGTTATTQTTGDNTTKAATDAFVIANAGTVTNVSGGPGVTVTNPTTTPQISFTGQINSVTSFDPLSIINNSMAVTVSTSPTLSIFHGMTTLAQIAAISIGGTTPFSWITTSPFNTAGVYNLTNSDVPNLDIAWLVLEAAAMSGKKYSVPAGAYIIGSVRKLPIMLPQCYEYNGNGGCFTGSGTPSFLLGDGPNATIIQAGIDFGALSAPLGVPLLSCGDPNGTQGNSLGRYQPSGYAECSSDVESIGFYGPGATFFSIGTTAVNMDGIAWGPRLRTKDVVSGGFYHDWTLVGDHTDFIRPRATGGACGFYWAPYNVALRGDIAFFDMMSEGGSQDSICVDPGATISGAVFNGETYLASPYGIRGLTGCGNPIMQDVTFDRLDMEFIGNSFMSDDNEYTGSAYSAASQCRDAIEVTIGHWYSNMSNGELWTTSGRGRHSSFNFRAMSMEIKNLGTSNGNFAPLTPSSGPSPVATFDVNTLGTNGVSVQSGIFSSFIGDINGWITQSGALPLVVSSSNAYGIDIAQNGAHGAGGWSGVIIPFASSGNYTTTIQGDLMEGTGAAGLTLNVPVKGVFEQGGITNGEYVPVATSGGPGFNIGVASQTAGNYKKGTGVGHTLAIVAGSGGTNGTFSGQTATGGPCAIEPTYHFTVAGGLITSSGLDTHGFGCTGAPSFPVTASAGLSAASLTPTWPGGLGTITSSLLDGVQIGYSFNGGSGAPGGGNYMYATQLLTGLATGVNFFWSGTAVLGTAAISSGTCATAVTVSAPGVLTTDAIKTSFNSDPTGVTGYIPSSSGTLTIVTYPSAGNVNVKVCNNTAASITPAAVTLNLEDIR